MYGPSSSNTGHAINSTGGTGAGASASSAGTRTTRSGRGRQARNLRFVPEPMTLPTPVHFVSWRGTAPGIMGSRVTATASPGTAMARAGNGGGGLDVVGASVRGRTRPVDLMTERLLEMFAQCNPLFRYDRTQNPRRVLTKPSRPTYNHGYDNEKHDYILCVNDILGNEEGRKYAILDLLGQGTFGQVVKCQNVKTRELVAVKVIKNQPAFLHQSMMEVTVLEMLNLKFDREDRHHLVRMRDTFIFRHHLCIVVELLSLNLYDLIKQNQYRGFSLQLCRLFLAQTLDALRILKEACIIHCDLKPENILLRTLESPTVKVIDFGSACHEHHTLYTYIQSRFYRSPEVLLGLPYSSAIDMWSLGCIAAELFLGLPIFPGASNYDQISRIVQTLGTPPTHMLEVGKETLTYFDRCTLDGRTVYQLKNREKYMLTTNRPEPPPKQYFSSTVLEEIIMSYPVRPRDMSARDRENEMQGRRCFLDFIRGLLRINPIERWSPLQASQHPFITGKPFTAAFVPSATSALPPMPIVAASASTSAATTTTATASSTVGQRVRAGGSRQRPRANTLSSLSLQDVPPQIQRLNAVHRNGKQQAIAPTERAAPEIQPERMQAQESNDALMLPPLPFEHAGLSPYGTNVISGSSFSQSTTASTSTGALLAATSPSSLLPTVTTNTAGRQPSGPVAGNYHVDRMSAYVNNRRVSNPVLQGTLATNNMMRHGGSGSGSTSASASGINIGIASGMGMSGITTTAGLAPLYLAAGGASAQMMAVPSSLPNAVWYGPETPFGMSPGIEANVPKTGSGRSAYYSSPRRASLRSEINEGYTVGGGVGTSYDHAGLPQSGNGQPQTSSRRASMPISPTLGFDQASSSSCSSSSTTSSSVLRTSTHPTGCLQPSTLSMATTTSGGTLPLDNVQSAMRTTDSTCDIFGESMAMEPQSPTTLSSSHPACRRTTLSGSTMMDVLDEQNESDLEDDHGRKMCK